VAGKPDALVLEPFRAVRYAVDRVGGLAEVTSPPYDVIRQGAVTSLLAADPHNVVRLILPQPGPGHPEDGSAGAAGALRDWLADGILVRDREPALYAYEQADSSGRVLQRGLIGAVRLSPPGAGVILPHEDVMPGPVAGRLELMAATQANLEPIFLLLNGSSSTATGLLDTTAQSAVPLIDVVTEDTVLHSPQRRPTARHRVWAITDPAALAAIAADLAPQQALIADGHHRYAAYLELQARERAAGAGPGPWDYGLAMLVDSSAYPPRINPIHRVIPGLRPADAAEAAKQAFRVQAAEDGLAAGLAALERAGRDGAAFLIGDEATAWLLTDPDPVQAEGAMPAGHSARWRGLDASVRQELLIGQLWGIHDSEQAVRLVHDDAAAALRAATQAGGTAVVCNPLSSGDVAAVAAQGERVPPKSTSFGPKPRTGLVLRVFG
jgi:uncharacterized protein (DUF1015 family)